MKKIFLQTGRFSGRKFLVLWIAFHLSVLVFFFAGILFSKKIPSVDADLLNMMPRQESGTFIRKADEKLSETTGRNVFILSCNADFEDAKNNAGKIFEELSGSSNFLSLTLYQDAEKMDELENFIFKNRFHFISGDENDADKISEKALEKLYSPFTYSKLENIGMDPFLLTESELENFLSSSSFSGTSFGIKDNVLAREWKGNWYVLIRGVLSRQGSALASRKNGISQIYSACSKYENACQRFVFSGTAFHSHKSSLAASGEIAIISSVSLAAVLVILLFVFRTFVPVLLSFASICISVVTAFLLTASVFKGIHVLTLVFGTTLIGSCIDYSLHFLIEWKANLSLKSGVEIRKKLFSGLFLSLVSTEICFASLCFAPFELLRQMALFSLTGIFSSFLSVLCLYPLVPLPETERRFIGEMNFKIFLKGHGRKISGRIALCMMFAFAFITFAFNHEMFSIKNDLSRLYKMEGKLLEDQMESAAVLGYAPRGWFMISGSSEDELISNEKKIVASLRKCAEGASILCTSDFLPSRSMQDVSKKIYEMLLPKMKFQLESVGEDESNAMKIFSEWKEKKDSYVTLKDFPKFIKDALENTWLGEIDGTWFSVIMPSILPEGFDGKDFASGFGDHVFYVNKVEDIGNDLDSLTSMMLKFFFAAFILIFIMLNFFYSLKQSLKIISIPLLVIMTVSSVFAILGIHLEFFSITGIILVFGLGLDYIIYMTESQEKNQTGEFSSLEPFAIFLSFLTTAISFGAIALSSFVPVHLMGLSILVGLTAAYLGSYFYFREN